MTDREVLLPRPASRPAAGAVRGGLAGIVAGAAAAYVLKETGSTELAAAAAALVTGLLQGIGKWIREEAKKKGVEIPTPF